MRSLLTVSALLLVSSFAQGAMVRLEVASRSDVPGYNYERIAGTAWFEVDPKDPHNVRIADVALTPRNAAGKVVFSSDFQMLRPKDHANGAAMVDIVNRGNKTILSMFQQAPSGNIQTKESDYGDGLLMRRGMTLVWVGWEFDAPKNNNRMTLQAPSAMKDGKPLEGLVHAEFTPNTATKNFMISDLAAYPAVHDGGPGAKLTVRDAVDAKPQVIDRAAWKVEGNTVNARVRFHARPHLRSLLDRRFSSHRRTRFRRRARHGRVAQILER